MHVPAAHAATTLRTRKVDQRKPLKIFKFSSARGTDELFDDDVEMMGDANGDVSLTLSLAQGLGGVTYLGVDKAEEDEHHLQAALATHSNSTISIPVPDASQLRSIPEFDTYYTSDFVLPPQFIVYGSNGTGEAVGDAGCLYHRSQADLQWLEAREAEEVEEQSALEAELEVVRPKKATIPLDEFEKTIYCLDNITNEKQPLGGTIPPDMDDTIILLKETQGVDKPELPEVALRDIYTYWAQRRFKFNFGKSLTRFLKGEETSATPEEDPYVCFRRREAKLQARKVRRSDTLALHKLQALQKDLVELSVLLTAVGERESLRLAALEMDHVIWSRRVALRRVKRMLNVNSADTLDWEPDRGVRTSNKRRAATGADGVTKLRVPVGLVRDAYGEIEAYDPDTPASMNGFNEEMKLDEIVKRERRALAKNGIVDVTENPFQLTDPYWNQEIIPATKQLSPTPRNIFTRRRVGRGGRIVFDRYDASSYGQSSIAPSQAPLTTRLLYPDSAMTRLFRSFVLDTAPEGALYNKPTHHVVPFNPKVPPPISTATVEVIKAPTQYQTAQAQSQKREKKQNKQNTQNGDGSVGKPKGGAAALKHKSPEDMRKGQIKDMLEQAKNKASLETATLLNNNGTSQAIPFNRQLLAVLDPPPSAQRAFAMQHLMQQQQQQQQFLANAQNMNQVPMMGVNMSAGGGPNNMYQQQLQQSANNQKMMFINSGPIRLGTDGMIRLRQQGLEQGASDEVGDDIGALIADGQANGGSQVDEVFVK